MTSVQELADAVRGRQARLGGIRLVCVDGPAGSGKTTLAGRLAGALDGPVIHLDDVYEGWSGLDGVEDRLLAQVIEPLAAARPARYRRYDWVASDWAELVDVPRSDVLVIEGCGSASRRVRAFASLVLWVEAPRDVRLERGLARDGEQMRDEWQRWMRGEAEHFAREGTRAAADLRVDGTAPVTP
ncbi:AAA family ATPase [Cellulomonas sp. APG4]|uniref:AAA family ATPase n=1 Tax=Cellulomonas sp. APG4 TaxID=1538656 RepID=UPI00351BB7BA